MYFAASSKYMILGSRFLAGKSLSQLVSSSHTDMDRVLCFVNSIEPLPSALSATCQQEGQ